MKIYQISQNNFKDMGLIEDWADSDSIDAAVPVWADSDLIDTFVPLQEYNGVKVGDFLWDGYGDPTLGNKIIARPIKALWIRMDKEHGAMLRIETDIDTMEMANPEKYFPAKTKIINGKAVHWLDDDSEEEDEEKIYDYNIVMNDLIEAIQDLASGDEEAIERFKNQWIEHTEGGNVPESDIPELISGTVTEIINKKPEILDLLKDSYEIHSYNDFYSLLSSKIGFKEPEYHFVEPDDYPIQISPH